MRVTVAMANKLVTCLDDIKVFAHEEALAFAPSEIVRDMMDAVAIAIQRGNAKAIIAAYERMMHIRYEQQIVSVAQMEQSRDYIDEESEGGHDDEMIRESSMSQSNIGGGINDRVLCMIVIYLRFIMSS